MPNAFATGRNPDHAVVCVTTGLLRRLEPDELEGVLAHELSHVAHKDVAVITVASFLGVIAGLIVRFAFYSQLFGGARRDQNTAAVFAVVLGVSAAVYAISFLLIRALSRYRELAADRAAALLTGRPSALASALTKVSGDIARIPTKDLRTAQAFNAFYFTRPSAGSPASRGSSPPTRAWSSGSTNWGGSPPSWARPRLPEEGLSMGLLDILLGRTKPVAPDLDQLFGAALGGGDPGGGGRVPADRQRGGVLRHGRGRRLRADAPRGAGAAGRGRRARGPPVRADAGTTTATPGWSPAARPTQLPELVNDLHAVNSRAGGQRLRPAAAVLAGGVRGPTTGGRLALVYLYKRGTFYPFAPLPGDASGGTTRWSCG